MRVVVFVKATLEREAGVMPGGEMLDEMGKYNEALIKAGVLLGGDGLKPSREAKRVTFEGAKRTVVDGPFSKTRELVAGYWVWEVADMAEAEAWAKRCPNPMPGTSQLEIRPVFEVSDFGEALTPEIAARHGYAAEAPGR